MTDQPHSAATGARAGVDGEEPNLVDLVSRLTQQGAHLAKGQVSLMQAEIREGVQEIKLAVGAMAGAAVLGIAGLGVLLMGFAYLLGDALDNLALGTIIVGAVTLVIAGILYASGRKTAGPANLKPERSMEVIADTPAAATGDLHHTGGRNDR